MITRPNLLTIALGYLLATAAPYAAARADDVLKNPACTSYAFQLENNQIIGGIFCKNPRRDVPNLVFVHGAPGNWKAWKRYLEDRAFADRFNIIAVDRPGYGVSNEGEPEYTLDGHRHSVQQAVVRLLGEDAKYYVVGHSYGGPVAVQLALDDPQHVKGLLLLAPSIDPDLEETIWYQYVADWPIFRALLPADIDVANQEIMALKDELILQRKRMQQLLCPVILIQGDLDGLVPPKNADYAVKHMASSLPEIIRLPHQNHFLPWREYDLVKSSILKLTSQLAP